MKGKTVRRAVIAAAALLAAALAMTSLSCGSRQAAAPSFDEATQQRMEKIITDAMAAEKIPGVIAGVWVDGRGAWTGAFGQADTATGEAMWTGLAARIASNTKAFTATVVLQLAGEGRLSLDDPLTKYVVGIPNGDRVTVRQLLDMTSGIYSYSEDEEFGRVFDSEPLKVWTTQEIMDIVLRHQPDFEPGAGWHYSDTNYYLLGMIAEQVTGTQVEEEVRSRVMDRLGLKRTWFPAGPDMPADHSHGYMPAADYETSKALVEMTRIDPSAPWTGGAMISSLEDLKACARALADGSLLTPAMQEERLRMVQIPDNAMKYGLGIASIFGFLGHTGAINGFNSVMFHNPELGATVVVIANKSTNSSQEAVGIFIELGRLLFPDLFPPAARQQEQQQEQQGGQPGQSSGGRSGSRSGSSRDALSDLNRALHGDLAIYRGAEPDTSAGPEAGMRASGRWVLATPDAPAEVIRFYDRELASTRSLERTEGPDGVTYSFAGRENRKIVVEVQRTGPGTRMTITIEGRSGPR